MTLSKSNPRAKRRWTLLVGAVAVLMLAFAAVALAVHDVQFQLDGDTRVTPVTNVGGHAQPLDWETLFDVAGAAKTLPTGFTASGFERDFRTNPGCSLTGTGTFCTADTTTFATGSKDTLPITPGWQCNANSNVNSKIDIMNAYSAAYTETSTDPDPGNKLLYFAMERNANTGDGNVGFWFLQNNVNCDSPTGTTAFTGAHATGDILVVSAFTKGGGVSGITAYQWIGGANGSIDPNPIATGVDCQSTAGNDAICATTNGSPAPGLNGPITVPWLTSNKTDGVGHTLQASEFFEGGINLTRTHLADKCFNVFIGDTRSSQSLTATLFDFARGQIGECVSHTVTTPQTGAGATIPATGLSIGTGSVTVRDHAVLTVDNAATWSGTVSFSLCGPILPATDLTSNCQTGGVPIGSAVAVSNASPTADSAVTTLTSAGRYCWRANFSGDAATGVPASSDPSNATSLTECFKVNPVTPTITTLATTTVVLGNPINDTATLSGTATQPGTNGIVGSTTINATNGAAAGGTITFSLYGPSATAVCTTAIATRVVNVSGDSTATNLYTASAGTGTGSLTPTAVGTYYWIAVYSGNLPNTNGATTGCGDTGEITTVTGTASLSTAQNWLPNDTATLTGDTNLNGTLTFTLYPTIDCTGTAVAGQTYTRTVTDAASGAQFSTSNSTYKVLATASVSWLVHYDDTGLVDPTDKCESTALTITN